MWASLLGVNPFSSETWVALAAGALGSCTAILVGYFLFVRQSGGHIAIESAPGAGTTIALYLPATTQEPDAEPDIIETPALEMQYSPRLIEASSELTEAMLPVELETTLAGAVIVAFGFGLMVTLTVFVAEQPEGLVTTSVRPTVPEAPAV